MNVKVKDGVNRADYENPAYCSKFNRFRKAMGRPPLKFECQYAKFCGHYMKQYDWLTSKGKERPDLYLEMERGWTELRHMWLFFRNNHCPAYVVDLDTPKGRLICRLCGHQGPDVESDKLSGDVLCEACQKYGSIFEALDEEGKLRRPLVKDDDHEPRTRSEELEALRDITQLASDTLSSSTLAEANKIAVDLLGSNSESERAKNRLSQLVSPPPMRPLFYVAFGEIPGLPRTTRNCVRYLGDYIDVLVKEMTFEFTGDDGARKSSIGRNLRRLRKARPDQLPADLLEKLTRYNDFLYTPGKHDFSVPTGRDHRFTCKEVVLTAFITINIADQIKSISRMARRYIQGDSDYTWASEWGSRTGRPIYMG